MCTWAGLRKGRYDGLQIIDATGRLYRIKKVRKTSHLEWVWSLLGPILNPGIRVVLDVEEVIDSPPQELKERVHIEIDAMVKAGMYREIGASPKRELAQVKKARSIPEVISIF